MPQYLSTNPTCGIQKTEISYSTNFTTDTNDTELVWGNFHQHWQFLEPNNTLLDKVYNFFIKATALGGKTRIDPYTFIVGCTNNITFTAHPNFTVAMLELPPGNFY